ncbi:MAG: MoxR family ATPase [Pseudomonadota bacterium]|nr:MoxR family ATPase [Pseudomonadota bacterium]
MPLHPVIVGRDTETEALHACLDAGRHVLLEGPVGVGKTALAHATCRALGRGFVRVDGDGRYTEARLVGAFDPPAVLASGYRPEHFLAGPLVRAMREGAVLFVNELNRMPEGVQNVLLPAMDEGRVVVPQLGEVSAAAGFAVVATQNPTEFVATAALSEALLDRFELVRLDYQSVFDELAIVTQEARCAPSAAVIAQAVALTRATRSDPRFRRGASVRAAIAIADIATRLGNDVARAATIALPTRVELVDPQGTALSDVLADVLAELKKKRTSASPALP